ncbi:hypothetical protein EVJ58_g230 [Rhodofomes roseus]|uniref:Uncharacterized protein n=1 Tax=Rhodofomes roseus TaxID=34475 RepID=A0A4Y9Z5M4_9APHY|nr:hypothetical protein EVJ58_g230 [Rhodofomes roseus]
MDEDSVPSATDLETWEQLLNDQTALFRRTATRNVELGTRVEELERELSVWKGAFKSADEEKKTLLKTVTRLERNIGSLKEDNPLVLCLIDGDGNIFAQDLLRLGLAGGRQAAALLTKGLMDHLENIDSPDAGRGQLWLTIYCNKAGLLDTLAQNNVCDADNFEAFVMGFNQASPLFSMVDVGSGKEAADAKIKGHRFPQTSKVFFGGAHDNGYTSTLNYLANEGLLEKVILLRGYKELAYEIKGLQLPHIEIDGLFMKKKLYTHPAKKTNNAQSIPGTSPQPSHDVEKTRSKSSTPAKHVHAQATPPKRVRQHELPVDQPLHKLRPPPCNFHYLAECKQGQNCRFSHGYALTPTQLLELRDNARKWPCPYSNRSQRCPYGEECVMGHYCPKGPRCVFARQGKCKFLAKNAHNGPPEVVYEANRHYIYAVVEFLPVVKRCSNDQFTVQSSESGFSHRRDAFLGSYALTPLHFTAFRLCFQLAMSEDYDAECKRAKEANKALLMSMGVTITVPTKASVPTKQRRPPKRKAVTPRAPKRKAPTPESDGEDESANPTKTRRVLEPTKEVAVTEASPETTGLRRSGRNRGKIPDYSADQFEMRGLTLASVQAGLRETGIEPRSVDRRIHDPKIFGAIPGIKIGTWWQTREECSTDAVHAPWVGGISGGADGAYSIALSGGYEDDVDLGEVFSHQSFENVKNKALKISCETKKPVRVIRGYKLKSMYAPAEGYRYDGLYTIEKAWMEKGLNPGGWKVCKFAFKSSEETNEE